MNGDCVAAIDAGATNQSNADAGLICVCDAGYTGVGDFVDRTGLDCAVGTDVAFALSRGRDRFGRSNRIGRIQFGSSLALPVASGKNGFCHAYVPSQHSPSLTFTRSCSLRPPVHTDPLLSACEFPNRFLLGTVVSKLWLFLLAIERVRRGASATAIGLDVAATVYWLLWLYSNSARTSRIELS